MTTANASNTTAKPNRILMGLTVISIGLFIAATLMSFIYPGTERTMGDIQRIFYIHLGSFFGSAVLFFASLFAGLAYLRTKNPKWDRLELAGIEIGLGFSAITIVTGMFWARPTWGTYWTWDPRLTTVAIMWLTYAAYLFLRSAIEDVEQRRRFSAIYAILAFGGVILTTVIIRIRPDVIHPVVAGPTSTSANAVGEFSMSSRITETVLFNIFAYIVIAATLVWHRIRLEAFSERIITRKQAILANL